MTKETLDNQSDPSLCSFILLKLGYRSQFILPIEDGFEILKLLSKAQVYVDDYNKPTKILPMMVDKIEVSYMSQLDINAIKVKAGLQGEE